MAAKKPAFGKGAMPPPQAPAYGKRGTAPPTKKGKGVPPPFTRFAKGKK